MVPDDIRRQLAALNVSRESLERLEIYVATLESWQKRINLIGPNTVDAIWQRHILDGAQLLQFLPPDQHIADLGTGAGIPGMVLAIAAGHRCDLFESNGKKVAFLDEVIRKTRCKARTIHLRIESLTAPEAGLGPQCVVSRALAPLPLLLGYAEPFLKAGAKALFHKGQDIDAELTEATKYWRINCVKHPSVTDSKSAILEVKEAIRVRNPTQ